MDRGAGQKPAPDSGHRVLGSPPRGCRLPARPGIGASSRRFGQKSREKSGAAGTPSAGSARMDPAGARGVAAATPPRSPRGRRGPVRSSPLPPASSPSVRLTWRRGAGRRGRGGGGLRGGSRACSGAGSRAAATAAALSGARPPLHQSFKPAWRRGVCEAPPPPGPAPSRPALPRHFRFLFLRTAEAGAARLFPQIGDPSPGRSPSPDLASHVS